MQRALACRVTTLFNTLITFIWVFILDAQWDAAFSESSMIAGYSWDEMRTYIVLPTVSTHSSAGVADDPI
jgi:hypothetical protein